MKFKDGFYILEIYSLLHLLLVLEIYSQHHLHHLVDLHLLTIKKPKKLLQNEYFIHLLPKKEVQIEKQRKTKKIDDKISYIYLCNIYNLLFVVI